MDLLEGRHLGDARRAVGGEEVHDDRRAPQRRQRPPRSVELGEGGGRRDRRARRPGVERDGDGGCAGRSSASSPPSRGAPPRPRRRSARARSTRASVRHPKRGTSGIARRRYRAPGAVHLGPTAATRPGGGPGRSVACSDWTVGGPGVGVGGSARRGEHRAERRAVAPARLFTVSWPRAPSGVHAIL